MIKKLLLAFCFISFVQGRSQNNFIDCDGTNDYVNVPNSANILANSTAISMSCKVFPKRITSGFPDFNGFAGYRNETNFDFYLVQLSSTDVEARFRNSAGVAYSITYTGLVLNQWNHFFLVYNGSTLKLYKGITEVGSVPASGSVAASSTGNFQIGLVVFQTFNWYHQGYIDEVSLWNKALLPADVSAIVSNSGEIANPSGEANLKLYYKFNQGIAYGNNIGLTTVNDEMAQHNGTLMNFTLNGNASNWGSLDLGVAQFGNDKISLYPNPANDRIFISRIDAQTDIAIVDVTGRIVSHQTIAPEAAIDVSQLHSGMYFMVINGTGKIRFVKK